MALMNVIPVVATIFGAAYAVQPAYGIGFSKDVYLWIPVLGNMLAVLVIPIVGNLSDKIGRKPPIIIGALVSGLLAFGYLYAISIKNVPLAIVMSLLMWGVVYQGYNAIFPSFYPELFPTRTRVSAMAISPEYRDDDHGAASGAVCNRGASRLGQHPHHDRRDRLRYHGDRGASPPSAPGKPTGSTSTISAIPTPYPMAKAEYEKKRAEAEKRRSVRRSESDLRNPPVIVVAGQQGSRSLSGTPTRKRQQARHSAMQRGYAT